MNTSSLVAETIWKDIESTRSGPSFLPSLYLYNLHFKFTKIILFHLPISIHIIFCFIVVGWTETEQWMKISSQCMLVYMILYTHSLSLSPFLLIESLKNQLILSPNLFDIFRLECGWFSRSLHFLFGKNLERATRIVDQRGVKRISGELSGRSIYQVYFFSTTIWLHCFRAMKTNLRMC